MVSGKNGSNDLEAKKPPRQSRCPVLNPAENDRKNPGHNPDDTRLHQATPGTNTKSSFSIGRGGTLSCGSKIPQRRARSSGYLVTGTGRSCRFSHSLTAAPPVCLPQERLNQLAKIHFIITGSISHKHPRFLVKRIR